MRESIYYHPIKEYPQIAGNSACGLQKFPWRGTVFYKQLSGSRPKSKKDRHPHQEAPVKFDVMAGPDPEGLTDFTVP